MPRGHPYFPVNLCTNVDKKDIFITEQHSGLYACRLVSDEAAFPLSAPRETEDWRGSCLTMLASTFATPLHLLPESMSSIAVF